MLVLSFAIGSSRGDVNLAAMGILVVQVVLFIGFELWLAPIIVKRHGHWLDRLKIPNAGFVVALIVMLAWPRSPRPSASPVSSGRSSRA